VDLALKLNIRRYAPCLFSLARFCLGIRPEQGAEPTYSNDWMVMTPVPIVVGIMMLSIPPIKNMRRPVVESLLAGANTN
jgi:hypothetical protein